MFRTAWVLLDYIQRKFIFYAFFWLQVKKSNSALFKQKVDLLACVSGLRNWHQVQLVRSRHNIIPLPTSACPPWAFSVLINWPGSVRVHNPRSQGNTYVLASHGVVHKQQRHHLPVNLLETQTLRCTHIYGIGIGTLDDP